MPDIPLGGTVLDNDGTLSAAANHRGDITYIALYADDRLVWESDTDAARDLITRLSDLIAVAEQAARF